MDCSGWVIIIPYVFYTLPNEGSNKKSNEQYYYYYYLYTL